MASLVLVSCNTCSHRKSVSLGGCLTRQAGASAHTKLPSDRVVCVASRPRGPASTIVDLGSRTGTIFVIPY